VLLEALALELALAEPEPEPEPELEHPAVPSRPAATTMAPSQVAVRRLKVFTNDLYAIRVTHGAAELNAQVNGPWREDGPKSTNLPNARSVHGRAACCARGSRT
jgi:hypothetical protein